jgi:predicted kinase
VVLVGLPGSGKSSFYRARLAASHDHVSKDLMGGARDKNARQLAMIAAALTARRSVAVDNTNPSREVRAPLVAAARAHGVRAIAYFLDTPVKECLARNRGREGRERVPEKAVYMIARRLQPPAADEGFDAVYRVVARDGFDVVPMAG